MSDNLPKAQVRKGICLSVLFLSVAIASILIAHKYDCPYLQNLVTLLAPVCFLYINWAYFGGILPGKWGRKHLLIVALILAALAIGLTWLGENL